MNRTWRKASKFVLGIGGLACSVAAHAHVGHGTTAGFLAGLLHPVTGFDHLLVILAVGMLAGQQGTRAAWALPVAFLASIAAAAALTTSGTPAWSWAEYGVLASMLAAGTALAFRIRGPLLVSIGVVAVFAAFHGYLHGAESMAGARLEFLAAMLLATAGLHAIGFALGRSAARGRSRSLVGTGR